MADWRKLAKIFVLGDGHISQNEVNMLRKEILVDGHVSKSEIDFLKDIKKEAKSSVKLLDELIEDCEKVIKE